jgi:hypothetical protein
MKVKTLELLAMGKKGLGNKQVQELEELSSNDVS